MIKDPQAVLDFRVDWSAWLADGDAIDTSNWTVPEGITQASATHDDTTATIWLSGGTLGETYSLTNRITTEQGRTDDRTIRVSVRDR